MSIARLIAEHRHAEASWELFYEEQTASLDFILWTITHRPWRITHIVRAVQSARYEGAMCRLFVATADEIAARIETFHQAERLALQLEADRSYPITVADLV